MHKRTVSFAIRFHPAIFGTHYRHNTVAFHIKTDGFIRLGVVRKIKRQIHTTGGSIVKNAHRIPCLLYAVRFGGALAKHLFSGTDGGLRKTLIVCVGRQAKERLIDQFCRFLNTYAFINDIGLFVVVGSFSPFRQ